jgi:signal transduction histidine kinase
MERRQLPLASDHRTQRTAGMDEGVLTGPSFEGSEVYRSWNRSLLSGWVVGLPVSEKRIHGRLGRQPGTIGARGGVLLTFGVALGRRFGRHLAAVATAVAGSVAGTALRERAQARDSLAAEKIARREAEAENRTKDAFLAMLSHELRQPVNAIIGWLAVFRALGSSDERQRAGLEAIDRNARALARLVDDLLDTSAIACGKVNLTVEAVELTALAAAAIEATELGAKYLEFAPLLEPGVIVLGDADRLRQILCNLLSNAVKFTPEDGRVTVSVRHIESRAIVSVSDNGQGISPDFLPHVFERFRQAEGDGQRRARSLGLGLSIVKQLVQLHGGTVSAESEGEGRGATFTVNLPHAVTVENLPDRSVPMTARKTIPQTPDGVRMLVGGDQVGARV